LQELLRNILRNATSPDEAIDDEDYEDEQPIDEDETNEVVNLCRTALTALKALRSVEQLDAGTQQEVPLAFKADENNDE